MADGATSTIGFVGLGKMGSVMARRIAASGRPVTGWARRPEARAALVADGGRAIESIAELAGAPVVITILTGDEATRELALGEGGLVETLGEGATHISMATISPALSRELQDAHRAKGQNYLAAPVFGRPDAAAAGALSIVCSGAREVFASVEPLLANMGVPRWVGEEPEQANLIKLTGNQMIGVAIQSLGEMFAVLRKAGVSEADARELLVDRFFPGPIYSGYAERIMQRQWSPPAGDFLLARKDNRLFLEAAERLGVNPPLARLMRDRIDSAITAGDTALDVSSLARRAALDAGLDEN